MLLNWSHQCHERDRWWFQSGVPTIPRARVDPRAPRSMVWVSPALTGASPPGRGGCAAAVVGDMCLFIGGADRSPRAFDDLWILRLSPDGTGRWVRKSTTTRGGARLPPDPAPPPPPSGVRCTSSAASAPSAARVSTTSSCSTANPGSGAVSPSPAPARPLATRTSRAPPRTDASSSFTAVRAPRRAPWATSTFSTSKKAPSDGFDPPSADKPLRRERCTPPPPSPRPARTRPPGRTSHPRRPRQIRRPQRRRRLEPRRHGVDASRSSRARRLRAHRRAVARGDRGGRRRRERRARLRRVRRRGVAAERTLRRGGVHARHRHPPPRGWTPTRARGGETDREVPGSDRGRAPEGRFAHACVALPRTATAPATAVIFAGVTPGADLADARAWSEERDGPAPAPASDLD